MAKMRNIDIGSQTISIPEWASEETLRRVEKHMVASKMVDQKLVDVLKANNKDLEDIYDSITDVIKDSLKSQRNNQNNNQGAGQAAKKVKQDFERLLGSRDAKDAVGRGFEVFKDRAIKPAFEKITGFSEKLKKSSGKAALALNGTAMGLRAAEKGLIAYSGYVTSIMPEYQNIANKMIDHGMVYANATDEIGSLQNESAEAGVKLSIAADTAANFAPVLAQIGGNTAEGMKRMLPMLDDFSESVHSLGDLGKTTPDLYNGFMEYLETMRYTGQLEGDIADKKDDLIRAYTELELEQIGHAAALGMSRGDALKAINASKMRMENAVAIEMMRRNGASEAQLQSYNDIRDKMSVAVERLGEAGKPLDDVLNMVMESIAVGGSDLEKAKSIMDSKLAQDPNMNLYMQPLAEKIFNDIAAGNEITHDFVPMLNELLMQQTEKYGDRVSVFDNEGSKVMLNMEALAMGIRLAYKNVDDMTAEEYKAFMEIQRQGTALQGAAQAAANETEEFLRGVINAITPNMQLMAEWLEKTAVALIDFTKGVSETFDRMRGYLPFVTSATEFRDDYTFDITLIDGRKITMTGLSSGLDEADGLKLDPTLFAQKDAREKAEILKNKGLVSPEEYAKHKLEFERQMKEQVTPKAAGGAVSAGKMYLVNEMGEEAFKTGKGIQKIPGGPQLFRPNESGTILNKSQTESSSNQANNMFDSAQWNAATALNKRATDTDIFGRTQSDRDMHFADSVVEWARGLEADLYRGYGDQPNAFRAARDNPMQLLNEPVFLKENADVQEEFIEFAIWKQKDKLRAGMQKVIDNIYNQNMEEYDGDIHSLERIKALEMARKEALQTKEAALQSIRELEKTMREMAAKTRKENREKFSN